jgi:large subunit ribosomal protein L13
MKEHIIDASNQSLGRVATQVAVLLMGKDTPEFRRNTVADVTVTVKNASKITYNPKKLKNNTYQSYSGYPGGRKVRSMSEVIALKGYGEVMRKAVYGMLPANRLRPILMKKLTVTE